MSDNRDGRPDEERERYTPMPVNELTGRPDPRTGFQTHDPKDVHVDHYTTTPPGDRAASADEGKYQPVEVPSAKEVTGQFDHLATRDPQAMEQRPQAAEFAGAQTVAGLGIDSASVDQAAPMAGSMGITAGMLEARERRQTAYDPNPGYVPPSQQTVPHIGEQPADLPPGAPEELRAQVQGDDDL